MGRDENMGSFVLRLVAQMVMNFVIGLFGAFVGFIWYLGGIIWSFQPVRFNLFLLSSKDVVVFSHLSSLVLMRMRMNLWRHTYTHTHTQPCEAGYTENIYE